MPFSKDGLTSRDAPYRHTSNGETVYVPTMPFPSLTSKTKLFKGGNNTVYAVSVPNHNTKMVLRVSNHGYSNDVEKDYKFEMTLSIKLSEMDITPRIYGYGYDDTKQKYWILQRRYDMSLADFVKSSACKAKMRSVEEKMIHLMIQLNRVSFCYDIHPLNVVLTKDALSVRLIDFDNKFCTDKGRAGLRISQSNMLIATLFVFANNHQGKLCGKRIYFRDILKEMLFGGKARKFLDGPPNLKKIVRFLETVKAQMTGKDKHLFTALSIMRYWRTGDDEDRTDVTTMMREVLFGKLDKSNYLVMPNQLTTTEEKELNTFESMLR